MHHIGFLKPIQRKLSPYFDVQKVFCLWQFIVIFEPNIESQHQSVLEFVDSMRLRKPGAAICILVEMEVKSVMNRKK